MDEGWQLAKAFGLGFIYPHRHGDFFFFATHHLPVPDEWIDGHMDTWIGDRQTDRKMCKYV